MLWIAPTKLPHAHKHTPVSNGTVQLCEPESEQQTSYRFFGIQSLNNAPTLQRVKERAKRGLRPESAGPMDPVKHLRVNQCRKCSYGLWWKKVKLQDGTPWKHRENEISAILGRLGCPIWPKKTDNWLKAGSLTKTTKICSARLLFQESRRVLFVIFRESFEIQSLAVSN